MKHLIGKVNFCTLDKNVWEFMNIMEKREEKNFTYKQDKKGNNFLIINTINHKYKIIILHTEDTHAGDIAKILERNPTFPLFLLTVKYVEDKIIKTKKVSNIDLILFAFATVTNLKIISKDKHFFDNELLDRISSINLKENQQSVKGITFRPNQYKILLRILDQ